MTHTAAGATEVQSSLEGVIKDEVRGNRLRADSLDDRAWFLVQERFDPGRRRGVRGQGRSVHRSKA